MVKNKRVSSTLSRSVDCKHITKFAWPKRKQIYTMHCCMKSKRHNCIIKQTLHDGRIGMDVNSTPEHKLKLMNTLSMSVLQYK